MIDNLNLLAATQKIKDLMLYTGNAPPVTENSVENALTIVAGLLFGSMMDSNLFDQADESETLEAVIDDSIQAIIVAIQNSGVIEGYDEVI